MGGRGHGKGKGTKGTSKSQCSDEEIRHAAQLNAWRESEDLPRKSPGSVTRAKAPSAAYHAAKAAAIDAQGIGPPAVKPPPPPPPPPRERRGERSEHAGVAVRLVERDETPLPSQPEASTVVLIERGEVLPREGEESAAFPVHRVKRRVDDHLQGTASRQRGEFLPRYESDQKLVTGGELLPQDAKALETDSETEQEPQALSSQTSSATPWQRRVKKREEREPSRGSEAREPSRGSAEVLSQPVVPGQSAFGFRTPRSKRSFVRLPLPCICGVLADLCDVAQHNSKGYGRQQYRGQAEHGVRFLPGGGFLRYPFMEAGSESQLQMGWMV